ncbi:hypothetical protein COOONC_18211 [Cooperia oncophora]
MDKTTAAAKQSTTPSSTSSPATSNNKPKTTRREMPLAAGSSRKGSGELTSDDSFDVKKMAKSHASGTLLKDLLKQGSKMLMLAASKADQFAPATVPSSDALQRLDALEEQMKTHQERTTAQLTEILSEIGQVAPILKLISDRMVLIDEKVQKAATTEALSSGQNRREEIKELRAGIPLPDIQKLTFDLNQLHGRFDALERRLPSADARTEPCPLAQDDRPDDARQIREDRLNESRRPDDSRQTHDDRSNERKREDRSEDQRPPREERREDSRHAPGSRPDNQRLPRDERREDSRRAPENRPDDQKTPREEHREDARRTRDDHHYDTMRRGREDRPIAAKKTARQSSRRHQTSPRQSIQEKEKDIEMITTRT